MSLDTGSCPVRQTPAQGGPACHCVCCPQAAPRRAPVQKPGQGGQHPHRLGRGVARTAVGRWLRPADHPRNQLQDAFGQRRSPLQKMTDGDAGQPRDSQACSTQGSCENCLLGGLHASEPRGRQIGRQLLPPFHRLSCRGKYVRSWLSRKTDRGKKEPCSISPTAASSLLLPSRWQPWISAALRRHRLRRSQCRRTTGY